MSIINSALGMAKQGVKTAWGFLTDVYGPAHLLGAAESLRRAPGDGPKETPAEKGQTSKNSMGISFINRKNEQLYGTAISTLLDPDFQNVMNNFRRWLRKNDIEKMQRLVNHVAFEYNEDPAVLKTKLNVACDVGFNLGNEKMLECFEDMLFTTSDIAEAIEIIKQKYGKGIECLEKFWDNKMPEKKRKKIMRDSKKFRNEWKKKYEDAKLERKNKK